MDGTGEPLFEDKHPSWQAIQRQKRREQKAITRDLRDALEEDAAEDEEVAEAQHEQEKERGYGFGVDNPLVSMRQEMMAALERGERYAPLDEFIAEHGIEAIYEGLEQEQAAR